MSPLLPFSSFEDVAIDGIPFAAITLAAFLVDLLVVLAILLRRGDIGVRRVAECALAGSVLTLARIVVLARLGLSSFGVLAFAWYDFCLVVPIASVAVLVVGRRGRRVDRRTRAAAWLGVASILLCVWMHWVEPRRLVVETVHHRVPVQREGSAPVRIAVLADLQTDTIGAFEREVVDTLCALQPDLIVVPGDLFHGSHRQYVRERAKLVDLLTTLALHGVLPFHTTDGGPRVAPAPDARLDRPFVRAAEADPAQGDIRIVLCHHGDLIAELTHRSRVDLVIAGHTHGGQVQVPWFGPPITCSSLPREVAAGGLFEVWNRTWIYQCRGIGLERIQAPRIRFNCPPTIGLIVLEEEGTGT